MALVAVWQFRDVQCCGRALCSVETRNAAPLNNCSISDFDRALERSFLRVLLKSGADHFLFRVTLISSRPPRARNKRLLISASQKQQINSLKPAQIVLFKI